LGGLQKGHVKKDELRTGRFIKTFAELGIENSKLAIDAGNLYLEIAPKKSNLFLNAHETLQYLKGKYGLYLLTNGFASTQMQKIEACNLGSYFSRIFIAELIGYQKPDRRFLRHAVKSCTPIKKICLMIGDDLEADN
jgi:putative hydrolase of the HAD superfamily